MKIIILLKFYDSLEKIYVSFLKKISVKILNKSRINFDIIKWSYIQAFAFSSGSICESLIEERVEYMRPFAVFIVYEIMINVSFKYLKIEVYRLNLYMPNIYKLEVKANNVIV